MRNKNKNIMLDLEKITLNVREIALRRVLFFVMSVAVLTVAGREEKMLTTMCRM